MKRKAIIQQDSSGDYILILVDEKGNSIKEFSFFAPDSILLATAQQWLEYGTIVDA
jgi:hypothetical protein